MNKIANRRSGDRAETFGGVLMQLFCAVAPVPRPEDFGIFDAIATILRRDGRLLCAEDSFLVQFKSRTEKTVEYRDEKFQAILSQELALFVAHVDMTVSDIKLYSVGQALSHPHIREQKGLVVHLDSVREHTDEGVLHLSLGNPVLQWTTAQLADRDFEAKAYTVMKRWLELDRCNRQRRRMGMQSQIRWRTNEVPSEAGTTFLWNPNRAGEALTEVVPAVQLIASLVMRDDSLIAPVLKLMSWLRSNGVEPDPSGNLSLLASFEAGKKKLTDALGKCTEAEIAVGFIPVEIGTDHVNFWLQSTNRAGASSSERHNGKAHELATKGFSVEFDAKCKDQITIALSNDWLEKRSLEIVNVSDGVHLLRKLPKTGQEKISKAAEE